MAGKQHSPPQLDLRAPRYEWAFDGEGKPIAIERAERGQEYTCPVCGRRMIPRLGEINQYHYAHEEEADCPPETVARIAAARWVALSLAQCLKRGQVVWITWPCRLCELPHTVDLLGEVAAIDEGHTHQDHTFNVALLDAQGAVRAVVVLDALEPETLRDCTTAGVMVLRIPPEHLRARHFTLPRLLKGATIHGGVCLTQQTIRRRGIVTDVTALRDALAAAALQTPYYAYGALETYGNVSHVLTLREQRLWLPLGQWQRAVGGVKHAISPAVEIITQEWPQPDGATVALYYVTVKEESAVAVRRFAPGEAVQAHLAAVSLRSPKAAALQVAQGFARGG